MPRDDIQRLLDDLKQRNDIDRLLELNALELRYGPEARALAEQAKAPSAFQAAVNAALSDINSEWREQNPAGAYLTALASVPGRAIMGTAPGKAIERASQRTTEAMMRDPGYGDRVGRVTTGIPWLDTASDVGGSILGQAALIAAASQMVGAGGAALAPHVPSVPPSPILDRAARGIMTAITKHALQSLSAPEEAKPTEKELARDIAFHATAGPAAMAIGKALPATMSPWTAEAIKGAGSGLASGVATMPFAEEDENHLKNIGMQMATMALFNVASLAANPTQRKAAEIARDRAIRQVIEEREAAEAAYRRFGIEMPKRVMGRKARQDIEREIRDVYRYMARKAHPDAGGTVQDFQELIGARDSALSYLEKANMPKMIREQAIEWVNNTFGSLVAGQEPPAPPTSTDVVPYDQPENRRLQMPQIVRGPVWQPRMIPKQVPMLSWPLLGQEQPLLSGPSLDQKQLVGPQTLSVEQPIPATIPDAEPVIDPLSQEPIELSGNQTAIKNYIDSHLEIAKAIDAGELKGYDRKGLAKNLERLVRRGVDGASEADVNWALGYLREAQGQLASPMFPDDHPIFDVTTYSAGSIVPETPDKAEPELAQIEPGVILETGAGTPEPEGAVIPPDIEPGHDLKPTLEPPTQAIGGTHAVYTSDNKKVEATFAVVPINSLRTSHDDDMRENPDYPAELQPRKRDRDTYRGQIAKIAADPVPERLGYSAETDRGAPIIGTDMVVESGNGRVIALRRLALQGGDKWKYYQDWLRANAGQFGVDPAELDKIEDPVLVRYRITPMTLDERISFAEATNVGAAAAMSAGEKAVIDARNMGQELVDLLSPDEEGNLLARSNREFVSSFMNHVVPDSERGDMFTSSGYVSQSGVRRMQNAIFAYAYGDTEGILEKLAEDTDSNIRNITGAMLNVAGKMGKAKRIASEKFDGMDITDDIVVAAGVLVDLRNRRIPLEDFFSQGIMLAEDLTDTQKNVLTMFDNYKRSKRKVTEVLDAYASAILSLPEPGQGLLFDVQTPTKDELLQACINIVEDEGYVPEATLRPTEPATGESVGEPLAETLPEPAAVGGAPAEIAGEAGLTADATGTAGEDLVPLEPGLFEDEIEESIVEGSIRDIKQFRNNLVMGSFFTAADAGQSGSPAFQAMVNAFSAIDTENPTAEQLQAARGAVTRYLETDAPEFTQDQKEAMQEMLIPKLDRAISHLKSAKAKAIGTEGGLEAVEQRLGELDAEPDIPPPARASSGGPLGIVAGRLPDRLRPISEVTDKAGSLLSYEYNLLPTALRNKIQEIDEQASMLNYLLSTRKRGTAEYNEINAKLVELEKQRIELEPEIENALGQKGPRLAGVKRELEEAASKVKGGLSFSDIDPETGEIPDGVAGYIDGQPIYGQIVYGPGGTVERYIPPSVEPNDEFYENLADQPNLYEVIAGLPRDVFGEPIVRDFRSAKREHDPFLKQYMDILAEIFRGDARNVDLLEEVTDALEGKADVSAAAKEIAGNLRNLFYGNSPNTALFREFEIDPGRFIEDYAPRIREQGDYKVAGIPKELSFFAEMYRTGELQPRERNALKIAKAYLRAGARKKFFGPVVEKWEPAIGKMHPDKRRMYEDFVNMVLGRPSREERITNELIKNIVNPIIRPLRKEIGGRPAQVITSMIADMTYTATIGGNIFSGIKNLTQQFLAIYAIDRNPIKGWGYWLKARSLRATPQGKELLRYCWVSQDRDYLAAIDIADNTFGMIVGDIVDKVKDALFFPYKGADTDNVHQSYTMGVLKALDEGKSWNDVIEFGNEFAGDTQYLYGMDNPTKLRGPFGRLAFMFMSWPINFMRLLYKAYKANPARIATLVAGYAASLWALSKATGIDFSSSAGPSSTVQSWLPVKALRGEMSPPIKAAKLGYDVIQMRLDGLLNGTDEELFEEVKHDFFEALKRSTVPAYSQYSRIEKFVDAALNDWWVYDVKGRKRYQMTSGEAVRGLFGPTMAARERRLEHDDVAREHREYQATRRKAIEAYLDGNMAEYRRANEALAQKWGRRITRQDIERELRLRETTAIERHRMGLPSEGSSTTTAPRLRTTVPKVSAPKTPKIKVYK